MKIMRDYVISISYGNYNYSVGGTDKVILSHQKIFNDNNISMLHLYSFSLKYSRFPFKRNDLWKVVIDGKEDGIYTTHQLCQIIWKSYKKGSNLRGIYVHHLRDINFKELTKILEYTNVQVQLYIHDFMIICPNAGLLDSNDNYCGAEIPNREKCGRCSHYNIDNVKRINEIEKFLKKNNEKLCFIAPSAVACDIFCSAFPEFKNKVTVIPHQNIKDRYVGNLKEVKNEELLKIAFVGAQNSKKGWDIWNDAVKKKLERECREKFFHFGKENKKLPYIHNIEVDFHNDKNAMLNNLRMHEIHVAVLWSLVPETYSYTFFEAYASNCFILTNKTSGNIAVQTEQLKNGLVMKEANDLFFVLQDEKHLRKIVNEYRKQKRFGPLSLVDNKEILKTLSCEEFKLTKFTENNAFDAVYIILYQLISELYRYWKRIKQFT